MAKHKCPLCEFIAHGTGPLYTHIRRTHGADKEQIQAALCLVMLYNAKT